MARSRSKISRRESCDIATFSATILKLTCAALAAADGYVRLGEEASRIVGRVGGDEKEDLWEVRVHSCRS